MASVRTEPHTNGTALAPDKDATNGAAAGPGADGPADSTTITDADAAVEKEPDTSSKLRTLLGVLRRFIGVADLASVRFSLPAHLLEPTPNLEYWTYLDRPETFVAIGDSDDPLERMLASLRFWFTKDLKYVKGKPVKPYNSTLGEFFRCNWEVDEILPPVLGAAATSSRGSSIASTSPATKAQKPIRVSFLCEQTSHHPPVSAFHVECQEKGIVANGYDQITAKFTGTTVKVMAGDHNYGIFITLKHRDNEQYQLTHPAAHLGGLLRGTLTISVADTCYITCAKTKIKTILQYHEEGWIGRTQNKVEGIIFTYDPDNDDKTRLKDVSDKDILGRIEGSWTDKVYVTIGSKPFAKNSEKHLLTDLSPLFPAPKTVPPLESQLPNESRRFWADVTAALLGRQYALATKRKHEIEDRQRAKAAARKEAGREWTPRFFTGAVTPVGLPELTADGRRAVEGLVKGEWALEENAELGA